MAIEGIFYVYAKVSDLEQAKRFYRDTLGWKLQTD
jgi:catechol 2,3-dioxygenase-like lactoylglutathione lyase family enzyme